MNTSELISLLQEFEEEAGGAVPVRVMVGISYERTDQYPLSEFDFELVRGGASDLVILDMS